MSVPEKLRDEIRDQLWELADQLGWIDLPDSAKAKYYAQWTESEKIGGVLSQFIDKGQVRVYIKDSLLKPYVRSRLSDSSRIFRAIGVTEPKIIKTYIKPHGCLLNDQSIVCWGRAPDWKNIIFAAYERAYERNECKVRAVVFLRAGGRFYEDAMRHMIEGAALKLGIKNVVWLQG